MGSGLFNVSSSKARAEMRAATGTTAFTHNSEVRAGKASAIHPTLDPTKKIRRESRDVPGKDPATPIGLGVDVTGSMGRIAYYVIDESHKMMKAILDLGIVTDPQLCPFAIGDATCDRAPLQVGEFEADDQAYEGHLSNIFIEGGGGPGNSESYELPLWFFGNRVDTDAWEKRKKKGYLFIIGDEDYYPVVDPKIVESFLGGGVQASIKTEEVAKDLQERWHVFCIRPLAASKSSLADIQRSWEKILPRERVIKVEDWHAIVPLIAGAVAIVEGTSHQKTMEALKSAEFDASVLVEVSRSLAGIEAAMPKVAQGDEIVVDSPPPSGAVRL